MDAEERTERGWQSLLGFAREEVVGVTGGRRSHHADRQLLFTHLQSQRCFLNRRLVRSFDARFRVLGFYPSASPSGEQEPLEQARWRDDALRFPWIVLTTGVFHSLGRCHLSLP